jgi:hypothetical protein
MTWACAGCKHLNTIPVPHPSSLLTLDETVIRDHRRVSPECPGGFDMAYFGVVLEMKEQGTPLVRDFLSRFPI